MDSVVGQQLSGVFIKLKDSNSASVVTYYNMSLPGQHLQSCQF